MESNPDYCVSSSQIPSYMSRGVDAEHKALFLEHRSKIESELGRSTPFPEFELVKLYSRVHGGHQTDYLGRLKVHDGASANAETEQIRFIEARISKAKAGGGTWTSYVQSARVIGSLSELVEV